MASKQFNSVTQYHISRSKHFESLFLFVKKYSFVLQIVMLCLFLYLLVTPIYTTQPKASDTIFTNVTLLSEFLFWGVWYGACLFSVIIFGRIWCGALCPLGALSEWVAKIGLKKTLPKWVKWEGWLVVMFFIVTIFGQTMDVRDDPNGMLKLFSFIFLLAIIVGFIFGQKKGRPWCRYFCPIGKILGVVSRLSIVNFLANKGVKKLNAKNKEYIQGRLCPNDYNLPFKKTSNNCIACGRCTFKNSKSGMGVYLRKPGAEALQIQSNGPIWSEIIFILLCPGVCAGGFLWLILNQYQQFRNTVGMWAINHNWQWIFSQAPSAISSQNWHQHFNYLDIICITSYMLFYSIIIGAISFILIASASRSITPNYTAAKQKFISFCYNFIPIAILSIVIGLCGKFFQTMQHDFNMPQLVSTLINSALLITSAIWSISMLYKTVNFNPNISKTKKIIAFSLLLTNLLLLTALWIPAIFNYSYLSPVEMIRQHIIIP